MDIRSYRARSVQEALALVRADLGPDAAVLHTREIQPGLMRLLGAGRQIEVIATPEADGVPSRLTPREPSTSPSRSSANTHESPRFRSQLAETATVGHDLLSSARQVAAQDVVNGLYRQLLRQQWTQELASEYLQQSLQVALDAELHSEAMLRVRLARIIEEDLLPCRPIQVALTGQRVVALVGPTGVGKTTTIAKLSANFRLRLRKRVGLITVDTYRIAAVEQLRTYADIIDLPMAVVSTPTEMREAAQRMANLDVVLIDTAGQSPHDEPRLLELRSILAAAQPQEVHLVLSTVASTPALMRTVDQFQKVGASSLVLTKLDEAEGLGNVAASLRHAQLPVSYLTHGQNVPDDIAPADRHRLARALAGLASEVPHA